ncbi:MAG: hypothetical protein A2358_04200 [Candidatus Staskawiczbacteria bacterium RIFOXYB1_FULL_37_44]|uniref:bAvd-like domain-containing protein n=1 Tax=Candidatus Staskawiczbacteria bacterium RIFOXYB1_FULL_37_44 TaxID=1802223 RepID=A0A1G2IWF5_9BACT|nr:MAG: hypothetical protein A2358_04200 [Candidatus Staskawiczbacteria bacterium RIFOXYB1_FULL_37_44]OGZ83518.1 MAG: hypothetical protein A2416_01145 [Candidatus Staskawiczbacteria bacterium RIFOXYC1_FULL_37_52]OGZ88583.1 MAG: hypothetical protein A2444_01665 [Candidatus Staskawiczbacteria bacterium RIFOXYC2_FULL_37_19]OGZ89468.1 MAG: hypothetical protein A2581_03885 [Candidatus Staskawiczbacteria bacterium RIFOXYD1_FULL_37_110]
MPVLEQSKAVYKKWLDVHRNIERTARFGIGAKIDNLFLEILELIRKAIYTPVDKKVILLEEISKKIDSLRFFVQLLWETHLIPDKQYISVAVDIENIGRIVGGWKKGIISKTSAKAEERKQ